MQCLSSWGETTGQQMTGERLEQSFINAFSDGGAVFWPAFKTSLIPDSIITVDDQVPYIQ